MYRKNYLAGSLLLLFSVLKTFVETLITYRFLITDPLTTTADYLSIIQAAALDESKQIFFTILFLFPVSGNRASCTLRAIRQLCLLSHGSSPYAAAAAEKSRYLPRPAGSQAASPSPSPLCPMRYCSLPLC